MKISKTDSVGNNYLFFIESKMTDYIDIDETTWTVKEIVAGFNPDYTSGVLVIPDGQRQWAWTNAKKNQKENLIDSIIRGYPIPGCILNKREQFKFDIYDGRHRIETLYKFKNDEFKWNNMLYSELDAPTQERFNKRKIAMTIVENPLPSVLGEAFIRINSGTPLKDYDMFWSKNQTPLMLSVNTNIIQNSRLATALGNLEMDPKPAKGTGRKFIANWVALVYGLATKDAGNITTSYFRISTDVDRGGLNNPASNPEVKDGIDAYCTVLENAWDAVGDIATNTVKRSFKKVGYVAAFFLAEWLSGDKAAAIKKWTDVVVQLVTQADEIKKEKDKLKKKVPKMKMALSVTGAQNLTSGKISKVLAQVNRYLETGDTPFSETATCDSDNEE